MNKLDNEPFELYRQIQLAMERASVSIPDYNSDCMEGNASLVEQADREILAYDKSLCAYDLERYREFIISCHPEYRR